ncbi:hypothetical protein [Bacillus thuringiensis]|uniref:hypothetical protein n=1 Tax=Bacillus thuringiensis TaxID=1428 RepID=UPI000BFB9F15|nr:hypothetical protein [Bacillus thuringiensis]PGX89888.1 hypothetical protein COE39_29155 [Bacillus thuringiensis]
MNGYFYRQTPMLTTIPKPWTHEIPWWWHNHIPLPDPPPDPPPDPYAHPYSIPAQHFQSYQQYHQYQHQPYR